MAGEAGGGDERAAVLADASGHILARALHVAAELGVADLLKPGVAGVGEISKACGADEVALYRLMHFLSRHGYFEEQAHRRFALTARGAMLSRDAPGNAFAVIRSLGHSGVWDALGALGRTLATGAPPEHRRDGQLYRAAEIEEQDRRLAEAMIGYHAGEPEQVAEGWDFSAARSIVDVGGSSGRLLAAILKRHPAARGTVFDRPGIAAQAEAAIREAGLEGRCAFIGGSFFENVPEGGDSYILSHIIHDWADREAGAILATCRRATGRGAALLVIEAVLEPGGENESGIPADMLLLANSEGRLRSVEEHRRLLAKAGFELARVKPFGRSFSILEARPA
jgi:hypothetical protein